MLRSKVTKNVMTRGVMFKRGLMILGVIGFLCLAEFLTVTRIQRFSPELLVASLDEKQVSFPLADLTEIFDKPLSYLNNGNEAIAFVSADDRYVVKFFLTKHFFGRRHFKVKERIRQLMGSRSRVEKAYATLRHYELGLEFLPEETAMVAVHQYRSFEKLPMCTLLSRDGEAFSIDLNDYAFVVQKKCQMLSRLEFMKEQEVLFPKFQELFSLIANQGFISTSGTFFLPNFALLEGRAVMIDLGKLEYLPEKAYILEEERFQERYETRLQKCVSRIR